MRVLGARHAHVQHVGKCDVGGERTTARHQRTVLETGHGAADEGHVSPYLSEYLSSLYLETPCRSSPRKRGPSPWPLDSRSRGDERSFVAQSSYVGRYTSLLSPPTPHPPPHPLPASP